MKNVTVNGGRMQREKPNNRRREVPLPEYSGIYTFEEYEGPCGELSLLARNGGNGRRGEPETDGREVAFLKGLSRPFCGVHTLQ